MPGTGVGEAIAATVSYVSSAYAAAAAGSATVAQTATVVAISVTASSAINAATSHILAPDVDNRGRPHEFVADPDAGIPILMGRRGVGGRMVYQDEWGADNRYLSWVSVTSLGPIAGVDAFLADGELVGFAGENATGRFKDKIYRSTKLGSASDSALTAPAAPEAEPGLRDWGPDHRLPNLASQMLTFYEDSKLSQWPRGYPKQLTVARGVYCYDWRQDSTFPGGEGPCRWGQPETYVWSENAIVHAVNWKLGRWIEKPSGPLLVAGFGAHPSSLDWDSYTFAANVNDANGWKVSAYPTTADDEYEVYLALLQAGGARDSSLAGKFSCIVSAPRAPVVTITAADLDGPFELSDIAAAKERRLNTVYPRVVLESQLWKEHTLDPVQVPQFLEEDGEERAERPIFPYVPDARQGTQLGAYMMLDSREYLTGQIPVKSYLRNVRPGDVVRFDDTGLALDGVDALILQRSFDPDTHQVVLTFRSETQGKHPFALGQTAIPPQPLSLSEADPYEAPAPGPGDWTIGDEGPGMGDPGVPIVTLTGRVVSGNVSEVRLYWRHKGAAAWVIADITKPDQTTYVLRGLPANATLEIGMQYVSVFRQDGEIILLGEITTRPLKIDQIAGRDAAEVIAELAELGGNLDASEYLANGLFRHSQALADLRRRLEELSFLDGVPVGARIVEERSIREEESLLAVEARTALSGRIDDASAAIIDERGLRIAADEAEASARELVAVRVDDAESAILEERNARVTALEAAASARDLLAVRLGDAEASILEERNARVTRDAAFASTFSLMGVELGGGSAFRLNEATVQTGARGTLASVFDGLFAAQGENASALSFLQEVSASYATQITELTNTTGGNTSKITSFLEVADGLSARAALALNVNGRITGYEINGALGSFIIAAEEFGVAASIGGTAFYPFIVTADQIALNTDVQIDGSLIVNGSVTADQILGGAVTNGSAWTGDANNLALKRTVWTTIASRTFTSQKGGPVLIFWSLNVGNDATQDVSVEVEVVTPGGSKIQPGLVPYQFQRSYGLPYVFLNIPAGAGTYVLRARYGSGRSSQTVSPVPVARDWNLSIIEYQV